MVKDKTQNVPVLVFNEGNNIISQLLDITLTDDMGLNVHVNPCEEDIRSIERYIAVCFGVLDKEVESMIANNPIVRIQYQNNRMGHGVVVLKSPVKIGAILKEVSNLLDIEKSSKDVLLSIGDYTLNKKTRKLSGNGLTDTSLTEKECAVILYLYEVSVSSSTKEVSREELLREVWNYADGIDTHTIETHIYRLRQKIEKNSKKAVDILVTGDSGYCLSI